MNRREIGAALDVLTDDVVLRVRELTRQYRDFGLPGVLKQAVDTPHRARAQITAWAVGYNQRNGANTAVPFLDACLTAAGSTKTVAQIDAALATLESQAQVLVSRVNNSGWTWEQVASAIEAAFAPPPSEQFTYADLPIPAGYTTVWGDAW
jgi:hypothetical protein